MVIRLSLILISLSGAALAEILPDPTRPPSGVEAVVTAVAPSGPLLQLIRTLDGKRIAVVSGQVVNVGSKMNNLVVTRIDEDRVILRGPEGVLTLKLFPDMEKNPIASSKPESKRSVKAKSNNDHGPRGAAK